MKKGRRIRWWRVGFRLLGALVLLIAVSLAWLGVFGLPDWATRELMARVPHGEFILETGRVRIHPLRGAVAGDVRLFRRKAIGPPFLEAGELTLGFDPLGLVLGSSPVRRLALSGAVFRSATLAVDPASPQPAEAAEAPPGFPDAGPVVLTIRDSVLDGLPVAALSCRLMATGGVLRIQGLTATLRGVGGGGTGIVSEGFATFDPRKAELNGALTTRMDPHLLEPLMGTWGMADSMAWVKDLEFPTAPPRGETTLRSVGHTVSVETRFWASECRYRNVDVLRADGTVRVTATPAHTMVAIDPLLVVRPEGMSSGGIHIDTSKRTVSFQAVSSLPPKALTRMIGVLDAGELDALEFDGPTKMTARGSFNWDDAAQNRMEGAVQGTDLMAGNLKIAAYSLTLRLMGPTVILDDIHARFHGGDINAKVAFFLPYESATNGSFRVEATVKNADFQSLVHALSQRADDEYEGRLDLRDFRLEGNLGAGALRSLAGGGRLRIKNGKLFMLPIFGGLTEVLTRYIPGLDFVVNQSDARSDFTIADGQIRSDKISIEGNVIRLYGYGAGHFDGTLDFRVQIKFLREKSLMGLLIDVPTWLLSKLFEFHLQGTRESPRWTAFSSTLDVLETLGLRRRPSGQAEEAVESEPARLRGRIEASMEPLPEEAPGSPEADESAPGQLDEGRRAR